MSSAQAGVVSVQFEQLLVTSGALSTNAKQLTSGVEELTASLRPLRDTWTASGSSAAAAADSSQARLQTAINDIINTINQFSQKMTEAHDLQRARENQNAASFGG
ncbi:MAG: WXG100 family type VII secretion target [Jatrophihabitantaceae bacterium]